ncbi:hypothetical protein ACFWBI_26465 [Streptomyces sp. NPDC059982]|uniref:D-alanyl-D-alanine carboxypeptidase family protein n=1 Tax=Streptomyces sp. NPDC059982 TaxID=3347024 RepID=UPI0036C7662E
MAGESPDKSVDEGASGAAESSADRDPRLSVFQPPARRDPLKEAVAAWVATTGSSGPSARSEGADASDAADAEGGTDGGTGDGTGDGAVPEPPSSGVVRQASPEDGRTTAGRKPAEDSASEPEREQPAEPEQRAKPGAPAQPDADAPTAPKAGEKAGAKPAADARTTAFGVVVPDSASKGAEKPGAAESERTAVFRALKPDTAPAPAADEKRADGKPADEEKAAAKPEPGPEAPKAGEKPAADVRTTAFGVVVPDSASATDGDADEAKEPARDPRTGDSERTAVFRAPKPDAAAPKAAEKPAADARTTAFGVVVPDSASKDAEKPGAVDSERTAVFRAVKPDTAPAADKKPAEAAKDGKPEAADSERTAVFRAVKPGSAPAADKKPAEAAKDGKPEAADSERTAVFRAVKPGSAPAVDKKPAQDPRSGKPAEAAKDGKAGASEAADSERTAVFRAVKPGSAPAADEKPAGAGKADARSSTFVPLRGDGPAAPPKPATPQPTPKPTPTPTPKPAAATPPPPPAAARLDSSERTTQQPLPPRPPLDMLADLTNNPPPPPSPLRTAVRRFKIYAPIVLLLAIVLAVVQLVRPLPAPKLKMTAKSTYAFPGGAPELPWPTEGQASMAAAGLGTIGSFGEQKPVPIASVTKSMTAYIILRDHPFKKGEKGAMIDVDKTAETEGQKDKSDNESTLNTVKEGDKISAYDAVAALMIPSANNIARLLARWDAGSQEAFVKKMNDTAKELGMTNTTYTDPSGLDATTVSTAEDQVKLGLKIVEIPALVDITRMPSWVDPSGKTWPNWNRLVPYNDSLGIKTGTTTKAGGNLLFAAQKKVGDTNQLIVGAVLGQHKPPIIDTVIGASKTLLVATQKSIEGATVVKKGDVVGYVDDGLGGRTPVVATADVQAVGWSSLTVALKLGDGGTKIPETAKAGTRVGVLTVGEGASQVKVPVALQRELAAPGAGSKLTRIG